MFIMAAPAPGGGKERPLGSSLYCVTYTVFCEHHSISRVIIHCFMSVVTPREATFLKAKSPKRVCTQLHTVKS